MPLRVLFLNTDYPSFLAWLYCQQRDLAAHSYDEQLAVRNASLFGTADFMSRHFSAEGYAAVDIHANNRPLQLAWSAHGNRRQSSWLIRWLGKLPSQRLRSRLVNLDLHDPRFDEILNEQTAIFQPTVFYNHDPSVISAERLKAILPRDCALVGQIASLRNPSTRWDLYDLVISSLPNFVSDFRRNGISAEYLPLAFESTVLDRIPDLPRGIPASFVGSLSPLHAERMALIEHLTESGDIEIWGDGAASLSRHSPIRRRHRGVAWGIEMFRVLRRSQMTVNKHIDVSDGYANNMRLFEATGMGACLVTDWKENLSELFEPDKEVIAYHSAEECRDRLRYLKLHPAEREKIARAGQARCLQNHTYKQRMAELTAILSRHFQ